MGHFEKSGSVSAPAQQLFDFLSDVRNLPRYFARMTSAEPVDGDAVQVQAILPGGGRQQGKAWFKVDDQARRITWGSERTADYSGELHVTGDQSASTVTLVVNTGFEGSDTDEDLEESLANIRRLVESGEAPRA